MSSYNYTICKNYDTISLKGEFRKVKSYDYIGEEFYIVEADDVSCTSSGRQIKTKSYFFGKPNDIVLNNRAFMIIKSGRPVRKISEVLTIPDIDLDHMARNYLRLKADKSMFTRDGFVDPRTNSFVFARNGFIEPTTLKDRQAKLKKMSELINGASMKADDNENIK